MTQVLGEIVDVLGRHGNLSCSSSTLSDEGAVTITVTVPMSQGLTAVFSLYNDLRYVEDVAQIRAFASRYGIPAERLRAFLPAKE